MRRSNRADGLIDCTVTAHFSSNLSQVASEATVKGFLEDYYCTSPAWSVRQSAQRVLMAINSWLYAQTRQSQYRCDQDRGYVCTLSVLVIKSTTAHLFHVGDSRVYRLRDRSLEQLTEDHRLWISRERAISGAPWASIRRSRSTIPRRACSKPKLSAVRGIVEQIAKGLLAFHRLEMLHQDLRPENIMIDATGTVKIMDFGSTRVAGIIEAGASVEHLPAGTAQYTAPEYFLGEAGSSRSDLFSLGIITYQMLSGRLPFGTEVAKATTKAAQRRLTDRSLLDDEREIPAWFDETMKKATHPDPEKRYQELSEFVHDLSHPNAAYLKRHRPPLLERHPLMFWKAVSAVLAIVVLVLLAVRT